MSLDRIEKYRILEEIGSGGMSVVYRGHDDTLDRDVAVKVLHRHLSRDPEARERFSREAKAVARLTHRNIPEIYDYSSNDGDLNYLVTELIVGAPLSALLREGPAMMPEIGAMLAVGVAAALEHAHANKIIHRDVKPENILASELMGAGPWLLTDFGAGRFLARGALARSLAGSLLYMAPEVLLRAATPAADQYSLGMVALELLTATLPSASARAAFLQQHRRAPGLPGIIARLIDPDPRRRFFDVHALLRALERHPLAAPPQLEDRSGRRTMLEGDVLWRADDDHPAGVIVGRVARAIGFASVDGVDTALIAAPRRIIAVSGGEPSTVFTDDHPFQVLAADLSARIAWLLDGAELRLVALPFGAVSGRGRLPEPLLAGLADPHARAATVGAGGLVLAKDGARELVICTLSAAKKLQLQRQTLPAPLYALTRHGGDLLATCGDLDHAVLVRIGRGAPTQLARAEASVDAVRPIAGANGPALAHLTPTLASLAEEGP